MAARGRDRLLGAGLLALLAAAVIVGAWKTAAIPKHARIAVIVRPEAIMGTSCSLAAVVQRRDEGAAKDSLRAAETLLRGIECRMSDWVNESEISRLNAAEAGQPTPLSPDTLEVLQAARRAAAETNGAFDITCRPLVELWKDAVRRQAIPTDAELAAARADSQWDLFEFRGNAALKHKTTAQVDLGGIAKGYAVDQAIAVLQRAGNIGGMVEIGGDLACFGQPPQGQIWTVDLQSPFKNEPLAKLRLTEGGVCTSGNYARPKWIAGRKFNHILDPTTGRTADLIPSVTVLAPTAMEADIWATALSVLGVSGFESLPERVDVLMMVGTPARHEILCTPGFLSRLEEPLPGKVVTVERGQRVGSSAR